MKDPQAIFLWGVFIGILVAIVVTCGVMAIVLNI